MYNLARAAEDGWTGTVDAARDYELDWIGSASGTARPVGAPAAPERVTV
jgi:hypothetical protein